MPLVWIWVAMLLSTSLWLAGCAPRSASGGFDSDNPASKLYAVHRAGRAGQVQHVDELIEQLNHDDPAVRLLSIMALERITGTRLGYNPYDGPAARAPAVRRWVTAYRDGRFDAISPE